MFNRRCPRQMQNPFAMQDGIIDINNNSGNIDLDFFQQQQMTSQQGINSPDGMIGGKTNPIIEPMQEKVLQRTIVHEVPQV